MPSDGGASRFGGQRPGEQWCAHGERCPQRRPLVQHVRIDRPAWAGRLMDLLDPSTVRLMGPHINCRLVEDAQCAGLELEWVEDLALRGLVKLIVAHPPSA